MRDHTRPRGDSGFRDTALHGVPSKAEGVPRSVAAVDVLGDAQGAEFAAQIDRDDVGTAILEGVLGLVIAVTDLVEGVADPVVIAEPGLLSSLIAQGAGLLDLAAAVNAAGRRERGGDEGDADEGSREAGESGVSHEVTHGQTDAEFEGSREKVKDRSTRGASQCRHCCRPCIAVRFGLLNGDAKRMVPKLLDRICAVS